MKWGAGVKALRAAGGPHQGREPRKATMFPMTFDEQILASLPLPDDEHRRRVLHLLQAMVTRRILPYFKKRRGTDAILLARVAEHLAIRRLEDEGSKVRVMSLLAREGETWVIQIHERLFDYLAFVIPSAPESRLGDGTSEERKMLAFAELLLRHQLEHLLYPQHKEREVILGDTEFAMEQRSGDPTFYRALRQALADEMNGLRGKDYLLLLAEAEKHLPLDAAVTGILSWLVALIVDLPEPLLPSVFPFLDEDLKKDLLDACYEGSRSPSLPLFSRTSYLRKLLGLFTLLARADESEALRVFSAFREARDLSDFFRELGLSEKSLAEAKDPAGLYALIKAALAALPPEASGFVLPGEPVPPVKAPVPEVPRERSLKDRIEEVRIDPTFPPRVLEVIDKNKLNAVGHSGAKYSELIETLLAVPWAKIRKIQVSPADFEAGLNASHYGLQRPKDIVCDFFTNLIWRYREYREGETPRWQRMGSAFLFVGPPGVGKTSFAISIAENLGIPYHKFSLGGMRDEADIRGHGFTYEGSKPGAIVQGLIKMGCMNGMFILDEADKTEKFAIATLLEILDPEQNHLFHDKYTQTTLDIDLSNCHFVLTANTLENVPPPVVNRCEVVVLDRYSVEEKIAIARQYLISRIRVRHQIGEQEIFFDPDQETEILRHLVRTYTHEAGVRQLERMIRTLFLRIQRKETLATGKASVCITREKIKVYLEEPSRPRQIAEEDRVGEMLALGVDAERGVGSIIPIQATHIRGGEGRKGEGRGSLSMVHATGNIQRVMDESRKVATTALLHCAQDLGINVEPLAGPIHLHFMGGSTRKDGPSAGGAIAVALASLLSGRKVRRDVAMTGEIDTQGRITSVGGLDVKLETAHNAGCKTLIIPTENLRGEGGLERLPDALKVELQILPFAAWQTPHEPFDYTRHILQVVAVDHIAEAAAVALIDEGELEALEAPFVEHARIVAEAMRAMARRATGGLLALYVKAPGELTSETVESLARRGPECSVLLIPPEAKAAIQARFAHLSCAPQLREMAIEQEKLAQVLDELVRTHPRAGSREHGVALVAPYFLLKRDGVLAERFPPGSDLDQLRIFANNYTVQSVKIKASKAGLNRAYAHLAHLDRKLLNNCPFLGLHEGAHVVDLSFIPEKYRLDTQRAEEILDRCLTKWLVVVERGPSPNLTKTRRK
jgi:endopeptidase La